MDNNFCIFLYSHSDYSDIWDLTFGQIYKYINLDEVSIVFCVDKLNNYKIDDRIKIIYYNNSEIYSKRILNNIKNLNYDYILFLHEDWVITDYFSNEYCLKLINFMNKNDILHIRSYKNYGNSNENPNIFHKNINIYNIPNNSSHFISLQPGLWKKNLLKYLYSFNSNSASNLENINSIQQFKGQLKNKLFYENSEIAQKSKIFPHIHTIAYGRWCMCNDKYNILDSLLLEYNINKKKRGYFNRKTNEDIKPQL